MPLAVLSSGGGGEMFDATLRAVLPVLLALSTRQAAERPPSSPPSTPERRPVVVELFSSEGCSSCPPADALLKALSERQPVPGAEIIPLEEHVDYWNEGGWHDPFSSREWTERQRVYAAVGPTGQSFTPEMVVDGRTQFIGGKEPDADRAIDAAMRRPLVPVSITPKATEGNAVRLNVAVGPLAGEEKEKGEVMVAVTEDGLESRVLKGENAGRTVQHAAVVRSLRKIGTADSKGSPASFTGECSLKLGSGWAPAHLRIVAFVQEEKSRAILGAASVPLSAFH
jgi:hypothetical protein